MSFVCIHRILPWNRTNTVQSSSEIKSINLVRLLLTCCRYVSVMGQACIADCNILKYSLLWQCVRRCVICVQVATCLSQVYNKVHEKKGIENTIFCVQEMLCFGSPTETFRGGAQIPNYTRGYTAQITKS